ncbi:hypothetical protein XENORESO_015771 [Xenotaenia resolanae]|uniref:Uncharacterized protein n=1 Tax=Xenotaenia resolanae TaxID=208358 RepID=A0ABV0X6K6_9TELE
MCSIFSLSSLPVPSFPFCPSFVVSILLFLAVLPLYPTFILLSFLHLNFLCSTSLTSVLPCAIPLLPFLLSSFLFVPCALPSFLLSCLPSLVFPFLFPCVLLPCLIFPP